MTSLVASPGIARQPVRTTTLSGGASDRHRSLSQDPVGRARVASADPALPSLTSTERFVGDLNPEAVIRETLDEPMGNPLRDRIGLWISSPVSQMPGGGASTRRQVPRLDASSSTLPSSSHENDDVASILQQRYVSAMQACTRLPAATLNALMSIYFSTVHSIIPVLDKDEFTKSQSKGSSSVFLERAICLVAAKDRAAAPHLRLVEHGSVMSPRQFCEELYKGLVASMDAELEPDRLTRIRILALMSLHCEGYEGAEAASLHLCTAIHQAQTVGLHLDRPGLTPTSPPARLFWCLWTLDKMHASVGGRPVLLADRDVGIEKPTALHKISLGAFGVWMAISDLLADVISFYRPSAAPTSGWEEGFPEFENIVSENSEEDLDFPSLGMLPLLDRESDQDIGTGLIDFRNLRTILSLCGHLVLSR